MTAVLVGIPTYRRPAQLAVLLERLGALNVDVPISVAVVDNDVNRSAQAVVERWDSVLDIRYSNELKPGVVHVRNRILEQFTDEYAVLIMVDDDQEVQPGWMQAFLRGCMQWPGEVLSGTVEYVFPIAAVDAYVAEWYDSKRSKGHGESVASTGTGNVLIPRSAWELAGFPRFDATFSVLGGEDTDFFARMSRSGVSIRRVADARVTEAVELDRISKGWVRQRIIRQGEVRALMMRGSHNWFQISLQGSARIVSGVVRWCRATVAGKRDSLKSEGRLLTGIGYLRGLVGFRSEAYGRSR